MVRLFSLLFKIDLNKLPSASFLFREAYKQFNPNKVHCPECRTMGRFTVYDGYERNLVSYENGAIEAEMVTVKRTKCLVCGSAPAVLPDVLVPYKQYSILFILHVLKAYYFRNESVAAVCERFCIAIATLYAWKKRYLSHKTLHLGKLEKYVHDRDPHLANPSGVCFTGMLQNFYQTYGFSFLQKGPVDST